MLLERLGKELLFLDGGMGTLCRREDCGRENFRKSWNLKKPEEVTAIHQSYFEAGSDIVLTNTFGANALKFHSEDCPLEQVVTQAVANVREAARRGVHDGREVYIGLDVGLTGKLLLKPMGDLAFEEAYEAFAEVMEYGEKAGADLIHIETMSDTYEVKAAVLAARGTGNLPVFVTMIFDERGKLLTGGDVASVVAVAGGTSRRCTRDQLGSRGEGQMLPVLEEILTYASLPVIVKPNAGLPKQRGRGDILRCNPGSLRRAMREDHRKRGMCDRGMLRNYTGAYPADDSKLQRNAGSPSGKKRRYTCLFLWNLRPVWREAGDYRREDLDPTGKKRFKQALKEGRF